MTASHIAPPHHAPSAGYLPHPQAVPPRRPGRPFVAAPVQPGVVQKPAAADADPLIIADAVLELLRTVNRNASRH